MGPKGPSPKALGLGEGKTKQTIRLELILTKSYFTLICLCDP